MLMQVVSAAYIPSARFARIRRPAPSCQPSNPQPRRRQVSRTDGHSVATIPSGATTWRATSDSGRRSVVSTVPALIVDVRYHRVVFVLSHHDRLDLATDLELTTGQGCQVPGRSV